MVGTSILDLSPFFLTANPRTEKRASEIIHIYNNFTSKIEDLGLETAADAKPLIDVRPFNYGCIMQLLTQNFTGTTSCSSDGCQ